MSEKHGVCAFVPSGHQGDHPSHVYGMGIFVGDRQVLTCAHVVDTALEQSNDTASEVLHLYFPYSRTKRSLTGRVDARRHFPVDGAGDQPTDVAVILLQEAPPADVGRARLAPHQLGREIQAFGFSTIDVGGKTYLSPRGGQARGTVAGALKGGRVQGDRRSETGLGVERGFSGAGVYDKEQDAVVGMMAAVDRDPDRDFFQFIDVETLRAALGSAAPDESTIRSIQADKLERVNERMKAIDTYFRAIAKLIPEPSGGQDALGYLKILLIDQGRSLTPVRVAFGFPEAPAEAEALYAVVASRTPSAQPFVNVLAQRVYHLLWRFEESLKLIDEGWSTRAQDNLRALQKIFERDVLAGSPTLAHLWPALKNGTDMTGFTEPGPDPVLYAVLRALGHLADGNTVPLPPGNLRQGTKLALDYLHQSLKSFLEDRERAQDTSNVWWAVRSGMCARDDRFRALLEPVAEKFTDIRRVPPQALHGNAVREIYVEDRTAAYTLSNIQAIFETAPDLDVSIKAHLHAVIEVMADRLLDTPSSTHIYLAAVHYEGLNNYLDYITDQKLTVS